MGGETARSESGWQVDTLKEHFEAIIEGNDRRYQQRFDAQEASNKYVQEKNNEFRGALDDVGKKQMPRTEAESLNKSVIEKVETGDRVNSSRIDALQARMEQLVKADVYAPAHEDLRRQRQQDNEKLIQVQGKVEENSKDIASMKSSLMWLTRLIMGAIILALITYAFQKLSGK